MAGTPLLAVPNLSVGSDEGVIGALEASVADPAVALLDRHSDAIHDRTVLTLAGPGPALVGALLGLAATAIATIDMRRQEGAHPRIGALDVCPLVWHRPELREEAQEAALAIAEGLAALDLPVFLYGDLARTSERAERAFFRRGGPLELDRRMRDGELAPDLGPPAPHPGAGAVLVTARPPLAAFNVVLAEGAEIEAGVAIAAALRESGGGLPGVRALAIDLGPGLVQISTNVHDPLAVPLGEVVERVRELAAGHGLRPESAELVGLVPEAALAGYPDDVPIAGPDPRGRTIESRLAGLDRG